MLTGLIVLSDGRVLSAGIQEDNAIMALKLTQCVNSGSELTLGSVCANMVEITLLTHSGESPIGQGEEFALFYTDENQNRTAAGLFTAEKPVRSGPHTVKLTAYDRVIRLDRDLTDWFSQLTAWPYTLSELAQMVCAACDLSLVQQSLPNGEFRVQKFAAQQITGRKLMQWIGQIAGRFCRATPEGKLEFGWYSPNSTVITAAKPVVTADGAGNVMLKDPALQLKWQAGQLMLTGSHLHAQHDGDGNAELFLQQQNLAVGYQGGIRYEDYQVQPVEKVQIKNAAQDVGTVWPEDNPQSVNAYVIADNYLVTGGDLRPVVQTLHQQLSGVSYTPCTLRFSAKNRICAGDILTVADGNGKQFTAYVMKLVRSGQTETVECTGSIRRDSSWAVNSVSLQALSGKVTELSMNVDGITAKQKDAAGNYAGLSLAVDGIQAAVSSQQENIGSLQDNLTKLQQDARQVSLTVESVKNDGVDRVRTQTGYCFDEAGLSIRRTGSHMENLLDDTGMYVKRLGQVVLQASDEGVEAVDVTVKNYLIVGDHARFEDYASTADTGRTACFWI